MHLTNCAAHIQSLSNEGGQLEQSNRAKHDGLPEYPPIKRFIAIAPAFVCSPILCLRLGPYYLDNKRRLLGGVLAIGGWLLAAFGWSPTIRLRSTWGWFL
jgi:hypothetical protein